MPRRVPFGPFEADLDAGELRKNGRSVRIQEQPFQILAALLERPGDVVTREELRLRLWPTDSFGDFDQGLNTAINKLREALGDSPAEPRFIETLPKRGYRFLFPVDRPVVRESKAALLLAAALAGGLIVWMLNPPVTPELPLRRFSIKPPGPITNPIYSPAVAISPNGKQIVFTGWGEQTRLSIRDLDQTVARPLSGTEGGKVPFWSPDSRFIGYFAADALWKVNLERGHPSKVCDISPGPYGGAWSPDGTSIVFGAGHPSRLYMVPANGGNPKLLLSSKAEAEAIKLSGQQGYFISPQFLPGGKALVYSLGYRISSLMKVDLESGKSTFLGAGVDPCYAPPGYLIYKQTVKNDLMAVPFSPDADKPNGEPSLLASNAMYPSVSNDGTLVYLDAPLEQLAWFDRQGKRLSLVGEPAGGTFYPAISPDGRFIAAEMLINGNLDIWVVDIARGSRTRITSDIATDILPLWSPNGEDLFYGSYRSGSVDIWTRRADAGTNEALLFSTPINDRVSDVSRDGGRLFYSAMNPKGGEDLWYLTRGASGKWEPQPFLQTLAKERSAKFSPDGRYVAYLSDDSGRDELYVRPFPAGDRKWAISADGASQPRWSRDGREIFFSENGTLMAVPVSTTPEFSAASPVRLFFHAILTRTEGEPHYDVSADRKRILASDMVQGESLIQVVQNWQAALKGRK
jgi:Tol biopolymer transport system component/DNA-binding winged helix-turn-helix (wHTH) protein